MFKNTINHKFKASWKKTVMLLLFLSICSVMIYADEIDDIIKNAKPNVSLEDANALNIYTTAKMILKPDSTYEYKIFYVKKILTYKGKKRYSDVKIQYFPEYQRVKIDTAFTIDTTGKRIAIPDNMIYNLDTRNANIHAKYIHEKEMILNFPKIEPNYYIVLKYTLYDKRKEPVSGVEHLMESNPYLYKKFELIFPEKYTAQTYFPKDKGVKFTQKAKGGNNIYTFEVKNMPLIKEEPKKPSYMIIGCPVVYTFYKNWNELAGNKLKKLKPNKIPNEVVKKAKEITKSDKTDDEKLLSIYKYFANNFSTNYSYIYEIDFKPEKLSIIQKNKYGTKRDIVALFLAYAKVVGIKDIYPAIVLDPADRFNSIETNYPLKGEIFDLVIYKDGNIYSPGNEKMPYGYADVETANIIYGYENPKMISYENPTKNLEKYTYQYDFSGDSKILKVQAEVSGAKNYMMRRYFMNQTPQRMKIWFTNYLNMNNAVLIDGPNFLNFDKIDENLKFNYTLKLSDMIVKQGDFSYFNVIPIEVNYNVSKKDRNYGFVIDKTRNIEMNISVKTGKKVKLIYPTQKNSHKIQIDDKMAFFKLESKKKNIEIKCSYYIPNGLIKKEDYPKFRNFVLSIKKPLNSMVFIKN